MFFCSFCCCKAKMFLSPFRKLKYLCFLFQCCLLAFFVTFSLALVATTQDLNVLIHMHIKTVQHGYIIRRSHRSFRFFYSSKSPSILLVKTSSSTFFFSPTWTSMCTVITCGGLLFIYWATIKFLPSRTFLSCVIEVCVFLFILVFL